MNGRALLFAGALCGLGCRPALDDQPWLIVEPRIIGWRTDPAEAPAGSAVTLRLFALAPAGPVDTSGATWTLCRTRKPLDEDRVVPPACLEPSDPDAVGDPVEVTLPADACRLFGPDTPQPEPGAPPSRPRDPDDTGGYFQPVTVALGASVAIGLQRLTCDLPDASLASARTFQAAYVPNQNPSIVGLDVALDGAPLDPAAIPRGARVTLTARWSADSAETYAMFDRASRTIVSRTETLRASWFATDGVLLGASPIADDLVVTATIMWIAPDAPGAYPIAFLVRDSRGGTDGTITTLVVVP